MAKAKKNKRALKAVQENVLHSRVSSQLVDGYEDVYLPMKGDDAEVGSRHDPEGQGKIQYEKVQVKSSKGDLIGAWKLVFVAAETAETSEEVEEAEEGDSSVDGAGEEIGEVG